jgi:xyloglucan-specific endo-beta-1,4-glucanase
MLTHRPLKQVGDADPRYNNESAWAVSWNWDDGSSTALHGFPNARLNNTLLPVQLSSVNTLWLYAIWTYIPGNDSAREIDVSTVVNTDMAATVVLDVFIDSDRQKAGSPTEAKHELMIWLAAYGGVRPIGYKSTPVKKRTVGKVNL